MMLSLFSPLLWLLIPHLAVTTQLASQTWRKPNITTPPVDRVSIVRAALEQAIRQQPIVAARLYSQMAEFDLATGQTIYQAMIEKNLQLVLNARSNFSDEIPYGRASVRAYSAYKKQSIQSWSERLANLISRWFGRRYTLSQEDLSSSSTPIKSYPVSTVCGARGLSFATGDFLVLSALLAEATSDPMYLQAASESADFINAHLVTPANIVRTGLSARKNDSCAPNNLIKPFDSAVTIQGLAILNSVTKSNVVTRQLLNDIINAAILNRDWQSLEGIIRNTVELVEGLSAAYLRNVTNPDLREDLKAYLGVQFNALVDLATTPGTNIYAHLWQGPPSPTFSAVDQTQALGPLLSGMQLLNDLSSGSNASPSPTGDTFPGPYRKPAIAPIIGGVLGGIALLAAASRPTAHPIRHLISDFHTPLKSAARDERTAPVSSAPIAALPIEDLVSALNDRLRVYELNRQDPPPNYSIP
ncbi:hypothetical protein C8J57DRAFT_1238282 [Mycena rebaudengoi]|nr:hypothetical protein C8J57DRAFT_1238282 [Mycena rebaudengoi]